MVYKRLLLIPALILVELATPAGAELIAYEPFDYANVGEDLLDKDGGVGFSGEWFAYDGAPILEDWEVVDGSLTFPGLETNGNSVTTETHFNDEWVGLLREFDDLTDESTTKYLSFLMRPEDDLNEGAFGGAFGVVIAGSGGAGDFLVGKTQGSSNYMIEEFFNTSTRFSDVRAESGETSLLVIKAEIGEGVDTFTLFMNPTPGHPEPMSGTTKNDLDIGDAIGIAIAAAGAVSVDEVRWGDTFADVTPSLLLGDFDGDGQLTAIDIDLLSAEVRGGMNPPPFDLNGDGVADQGDRTVWVEQLKSTWFGDANLDGEFNSADLVQVFQRGEYEDQEDSNSTWEDGDWNGDGDLTSGDLVTAFQDGGFEAGLRTDMNAVPEPAGVLWLLLGVGGCLSQRRKILAESPIGPISDPSSTAGAGP